MPPVNHCRMARMRASFSSDDRLSLAQIVRTRSTAIRVSKASGIPPGSQHAAQTLSNILIHNSRT
eukprot:1194694-Prorocentrum_minimum.AAC.11